MIFSFRMATARKFTRSAVDADASKFGLWLCNSIHPSIVDISSWTRDVLHRGWRFHVARAPRYPVAFENSCPGESMRSDATWTTRWNLWCAKCRISVGRIREIDSLRSGLFQRFIPGRTVSTCVRTFQLSNYRV